MSLSTNDLLARPIGWWCLISWLDKDLKRRIAARVAVDERAIWICQVASIAQRVNIQGVRNEILVGAICCQIPEPSDGRLSCECKDGSLSRFQH